MATDSSAESLYKAFQTSSDFHEVRELFSQMCKSLDVSSSDYPHVYENIKTRLKVESTSTPWRLLDKRASQTPYQKGQICKDCRILVIGAGPCGLRMAIEAALLGAKVKVVEARDYFARNNVLHLWPFVIQDMRNLGTKVFYPQFCVGPMDHVSIRRMQLMLLKIALLLGVQIEAPVSFQGLVEPADGRGWRAQLSPSTHAWNECEYDVIVGADGKRNTLPGFKRKCFRGKMAIAITANFVNHHTKVEAALEEIGGIFYVFRQEFFNSLKQKTGIDLENFVYYKNETHYFVMTAKKGCLLKKGVLKQNFPEPHKLMARDNINQERLLAFAREAAEVSTNHVIPDLTFAKNHHDQDDVAIFDFTNMFQADNSCAVVERQGKKLLKAIVGDTVIEPFWPTGSGCARGFLTVFDAAWLIRHWTEGTRPPLEVLAERESMFQMLSQTSPSLLKKNINQYTIDPISRYGSRLKTDSIKAHQVRHLYDDGTEVPDVESAPQQHELEPPKPKRQESFSSDAKELLLWYQNQLKPYEAKVKVTNLTSSWSDGVALCTVVHHFCPQLISLDDIMPQQPINNIEKVFRVVEEELAVQPTLSARELSDGQTVDSAAMFVYLTRLQQALEVHLAGGEEVTSTADHYPAGGSLMAKLSSLGMFKPVAKITAGSIEDWSADSQSDEDSEPEPEVGEANLENDLEVCRGVTSRGIKRYSFLQESQDDVSYLESEPRKAKEGPESGLKTEFTADSANTIVASTVADSANIQEDPDNSTATTNTADSVNTTPESVMPSDDSVGNIADSAILTGMASVLADVSERPPRLSVHTLSQNIDSEAKRGQEERAKRGESVGVVNMGTCVVCGKPLFPKDRVCANASFLHHWCFRCAECKCSLRQGNALPLKHDDSTVSFYCFRHAYNIGLFHASKKRSKWIVTPSGQKMRVPQDTSSDDPMITKPTQIPATENEEQTGDEPIRDELEQEQDEPEAEKHDQGEDLDDLVMENQSYSSFKSVQLLVMHELQQGSEDPDDSDENEAEVEKEGAEKQTEEMEEASSSAKLQILTNVVNASPETPRIKDDPVEPVTEENAEETNKQELQKRLDMLQSRLDELQAMIDGNQEADVEETIETLECDTTKLEEEIRMSTRIKQRGVSLFSLAKSGQTDA